MSGRRRGHRPPPSHEDRRTFTQRLADPNGPKAEPTTRRPRAGAVKPLALVGKSSPVLHEPARAVLPGSQDELRLVELHDRIVATCRVKVGFAVAAPQVGIGLRAVTFREGVTWLNPEVRILGDEHAAGLEGCLSLPGRWYTVDRFLRVQVAARELGATEATIWEVSDPIQARVWQHEADHLAGRLISDRWPEAQRRGDRRDLHALPPGAAERLARNASRLGD